MRRRGLLLAAAGLLPVLAGCAAGNNAPVQQWHQPTPGAAAQIGGISISNVFILGAANGQALPPGRSAGMYLGLVNSGAPDTLTSVSAPATASGVVLPGGSVSLPARQSVLLTGPQPQVVLTSLQRPLPVGGSARVTLTFRDAGSVSLLVPVRARAQDYATYSPAAAPQPSRSQARQGHRNGGGTPQPTPSPS